ncbi:MAG: NUDIX hydrolase [Patescibacteria group bacterium]
MPRTLYDNNGWKILLEESLLPDGRKAQCTRVHRSDAVHVLAFPSSETILLLREYRAFHREWRWMLPSGLADKEHDIAVAAQRELQEETGYRAKMLRHYFSTQNSEHIVMTNHIFIASDLESDPLEQDEHELIEVHEVPIKEAVHWVSENRYEKHTPSAYALLRYGAEHGLLA